MGSEFPTCELNFGYYRIPAARTLAQMAAKVLAGFLFTVKAYRGITHEREDPEPHLEQFRVLSISARYGSIDFWPKWSTPKDGVREIPAENT